MRSLWLCSEGAAQKVDKHLENVRAIEKNIEQVIAQERKGYKHVFSYSTISPLLYKKRKKKKKKKAQYGRKPIWKAQVIE